MRNLFYCCILLMMLVKPFTQELSAKPLAAMTDAEIEDLSDAQLNELIITDWSGIFTFMTHGVKYHERIVNAFADNFKKGAIAWTKKGTYPTVDYVCSDDIVYFYKNWYIGVNSCKRAVIIMNNSTMSKSMDDAFYKIMNKALIFDQKISAGLINVTPPEYLDATTIINSMNP